MKTFLVLIVSGIVGAVSSTDTRLCGCQPTGPICASDQVTYESECHMRCGDVLNQKYILHEGACGLCGCKPIGPICVSDGRTLYNYESECQMRCNEIVKRKYVLHDGWCNAEDYRRYGIN